MQKRYRFHCSDSQPRGIMPPRKHSAMYGDFFGYQKGGGGYHRGKDVAVRILHTILMYRTTTNNNEEEKEEEEEEDKRWGDYLFWIKKTQQ